MIAAAWLMVLAGPALASPDLTPRCDGAREMRSTVADVERPVRHVFQNGGQVPLQVSWIDPQGKRIDMGVIPPGRFKSLQTIVGHVFILSDPDDRCRAAVRVGDVLTGTYVGASRYRPVAVRGWHVFVDRALNPATEPALSALATIERMLRATEAAVPSAAVDQMRLTPIFLNEHAGNGEMFHYDPDWLVAHGRTVELTDAIEISDASVFIETARVQPSAVLHELAHAYYAKLTAAEHADIEATYRGAIGAGLYRRVARHDGTTGPAYAMSNSAEYFAELSEAYFGRNDFFPFTRSELAAHDPDGARLMRRIWYRSTRSPSAP